MLSTLLYGLFTTVSQCCQVSSGLLRQIEKNIPLLGKNSPLIKIEKSRFLFFFISSSLAIAVSNNKISPFLGYIFNYIWEK
jgi:hypothetical protein